MSVLCEACCQVNINRGFVHPSGFCLWKKLAKQMLKVHDECFGIVCLPICLAELGSQSFWKGWRKEIISMAEMGLGQRLGQLILRDKCVHYCSHGFTHSNACKMKISHYTAPMIENKNSVLVSSYPDWKLNEGKKDLPDASLRDALDPVTFIHPLSALIKLFK